MSEKISYSKSGDFASGVRNNRLFLEISGSSFAGATFLYSNIVGDDVQIYFDVSPTGSDLITLDAIIAAHDGTADSSPSGTEGIDAVEPFLPLLVSGYPGMSGNIDMGGYDVVNILGTASFSASSHQQRHIQAGADEIDGDKLDIDFTPVNYTPSTSPSEVDDEDQLSAHLAGIDTEIGNFATGSGVTPEQHKALKDIIHFIDSGPGDGFGTGSYEELEGNILFPDKLVWWDAPAKTNKIFEIEYSYTGSATNITPTPIVYRMYDAAGSFLVGLKDDITYQGVLFKSRIRSVLT